MKEKEAIEWLAPDTSKLKINMAELNGENPLKYINEAIDVSISAMQKQIPYKPKEYEDKYYACKCGNNLMEKWFKYPTIKNSKSEGLPYCLICGQKIDWSDE